MCWRICWAVSIYKNSIIGEIMTPFQGVKVEVVKKWIFGFLGSGGGSFVFLIFVFILSLELLIFYKI